MSNVDKILKKMNDVLKKITAKEIIERLEEDKKLESDIEIYQSVVINEADSYVNDSKYKRKLKIKYNKFDYYNDYEEEETWINIKAS